MKKVMMFVAVAVCAVAVQGAQVIWGNNTETGTTVPIYNLDGTLMTRANATAVGLVVQLINVTQGDTVVGSTSLMNNMTAGALENCASDYVFGENGFAGDRYKIVMFATFGGDEYTMTLTNESWINAAVNQGSVNTIYWAAGSTAPDNWVLIPEPTAMALLALGAAAVGLRRRFRK